MHHSGLLRGRQQWLYVIQGFSKIFVILKLFICLLFLELRGSHYIAQAGLAFLVSYNPPASASWSS